MVADDDFASTLAAAQAGDERAVASLYGRHQAKVLRYLRSQAPGAADDLAADTWLDVARSLRRFRGDEDGFTAWVFTIARRRLIDHRRAHGRRPTEPLAALRGQEPAATSAEQAALDGTVADDGARRILDLLPPEQAEILLLRIIGDLDVETVARITGRRPGTVRVIQHRALRRLADAIGDGRNAREVTDDGTERDAHAPTHQPG